MHLSVKGDVRKPPKNADKSNERSEGVKQKKKAKYTPDLPGRLYLFFISYDDRGAPSFLKFARSIGATTADIERFRSHRQFDLAYRECQQIRKDFLIDRALDRRFDPSFVKFILSAEGEGDGNGTGGEFVLSLEVKD